MHEYNQWGSTILGPIPFLLHLNDLANVSDILNLIMFADDTNAFLSHNSLETLFDIINTELEKNCGLV